MQLRSLFMMVFIMLTGLAASAQLKEEPFSIIKPQPLKPFNKWYQEGRLIDSVGMGKVYRMPVDNMHCLVPDAAKNARMPVKRTRIPERMPNPFSRRDSH